MTETTTWAWVVDTTWPGFDPANQNNLGSNGNLMPVDPNAYRVIRWVDANSDDQIMDADTDDGSVANGDGVRIGGVTRTVAEVARYDGTIVMVDGTQLTVTMPVWLFTDGTWMTRLNDADIPPGKSHVQVTQITLGFYDGVEYSGTWISTRDQAFVCFTSGTLIDTANGPRRVEDLAVGDLVVTLDHGLQPVRWRGRRTVAGRGRAAPVRIAAGTLGNMRDLVVSRRHRMLVTGWRAELVTGEAEVLIAAADLVNDTTIRPDPCDSVTYVHILFDRHEIVFAEGAPSESFYPGAVALDRLEAPQREELLTIFPELDPLSEADRDGPSFPLARPVAQGRAGRLLV